MKEARKGTEGGRQPVETGTSPRPGGSGEGARSALEHLLQQERKRVAQSPREGGAPEGARQE